MNILECPYCGTKLDDPDECHKEDVTYEYECPCCEKNFVFGVSYIRHYQSHKAECLNDGEHDYKKTATFPVEFAVLRCTMCSHEKQIPNGSNG